MYFVTDEPKLINIETGTVIYIINDCVWLGGHVTDEDEKAIFKGTSQECEDFIYSLAGWVGAVNPMAKVEKNGS